MRRVEISGRQTSAPWYRTGAGNARDGEIFSASVSATSRKRPAVAASPAETRQYRDASEVLSSCVYASRKVNAIRIAPSPTAKAPGKDEPPKQTIISPASARNAYLLNAATAWIR